MGGQARRLRAAPALRFGFASLIPARFALGTGFARPPHRYRLDVFLLTLFFTIYIMQKYDSYKSSGIEWIGEIPSHWEVKKLKRLTSIKRGASPRPIDDPKYFNECGEFAWVRIADVSASERYLINTLQKLSDLGASLSVKRYPNDFFLSIAGSVGKPIITKIKCCIHDGFVYFPDLKINPEFLYYIFSTDLPYQGLGKLGTQLNLNTETVGEISIPLPPNIDLIVSYLDRKTAEIDSLISDKKQLLALYEAEKTAIINNAVTKGIKAGVAMRDSGVEWLGEIPSHWAVSKVKYNFLFTTGFTPSSGKNEYYDNGTNIWITIGDLNSKYVGDSTTKLTHKAITDFKPRPIPAGALLYSFKLSVGKVAFTTKECYTNEAIFAIIPNSNNNLNYYYYSLPSQIIQNANVNIYGAKILNQELIKNAYLAIPPLLEQAEIVSYIEGEVSRIAAKVSNVNQLISLLEEYRSALISEVVTGKVRVV